uniref:Pre-mRNA splicing factor n=1 Tax=Neospora caninum (strain Liverpool) TaxID=572307 RepID=A0A0F7UD28_NEOCL|nr:TPA: hypothetical protein BN1204_021000 [Neospora caninum Liverpool]
MLPHQLKRAVAEAEAHAAAQAGAQGGDGRGEALPAGEADRLRQLQKDRAQLQLRKLQADAGLISKQAAVVAAAGLEWLYDQPKGREAQEAEREAYLLGKPIAAPSASSASASRAEQVAAARAGGRDARRGEVKSAALFLPTGALLRASDDTLRKLREDPLFLIKQAEVTQKKIKEANPMLRQREQERRERQREEEEAKRRKRERKEARKLRKQMKKQRKRRRREADEERWREERRHRRSRSDSDSSDSDSSNEDTEQRDERRERYGDSRRDDPRRHASDWRRGDRRGGGRERGRSRDSGSRERTRDWRVKPEMPSRSDASSRAPRLDDARTLRGGRRWSEELRRTSRSISEDRGRRERGGRGGRNWPSSSPEEGSRDARRKKGSDSGARDSSSSPSRSRERPERRSPHKGEARPRLPVKEEPLPVQVKREPSASPPRSSASAGENGAPANTATTRRLYGPARPDVAAIQTEAFGVTDEIAPPAAIQEKARALQEQREAQQKAAVAARNAAIDQAVRERREQERKKSRSGDERSEGRSEAADKLQEMKEAGLRHEADKARKHELLTMKETLQAQLEEKWRVKTEGGELFNSMQRQAFFSEGKTVEDFLQRRRARRRKGADDDDILATNAEQR